jgi:hypothetical protein
MLAQVFQKKNFYGFTMGAESITRAKSIARGCFAANYDTLKVVFWQIQVIVLK